MRCKIALAAGTLATLVTGGQASAENPSWGGFYVDGAIGARSSSIDLSSRWRLSYVDSSPGESLGMAYIPPYSESGAAQERQSADLGSTNFLGQISAGWRWDNGQIVAGIGLFYDLAGDDAGSLRQDYLYSRSYYSPGYSLASVYSDWDSVSLKQSNRWGISVDIAPAWRTQPYLKLAYSWADIEVDARTSECPRFGPGQGPTAWRVSDTYSGIGVGGGLRHLYNDHLYFFAEAMWQNLGSNSQNVTPICSQPVASGATIEERISADATNIIGVIGVGWKF